MKSRERYKRNAPAISEEETEGLAKKTVLIAGCGGLGGFILEMLLRLGVGKIICIDPDAFEESNLNRQLLCREDNLGEKKVDAAARRAALINSRINVETHSVRLDDKNIETLCSSADLIMDALDSAKDRILLERCAEELTIPLVHGAIDGWFGQVCTILPGDRILSSLYDSSSNSSETDPPGSPVFSPAAVASCQVAEAVKLLLNKGEILRNRLLYIDLLNQGYQIINLSPHGEEAQRQD